MYLTLLLQAFHHMNNISDHYIESCLFISKADMTEVDQNHRNPNQTLLLLSKQCLICYFQRFSIKKLIQVDRDTLRFKDNLVFIPQICVFRCNLYPEVDKLLPFLIKMHLLSFETRRLKKYRSLVLI